MRQTLLSISLFVALTQAGWSQTAPDLSWIRHLNSSEMGMITSIDTLSNGNYALAGYKINSDPNNKDLLIAVTDKHSQKIWSKVFAGEGNDFLRSVKEDADGYLVAVGYTWSSTNQPFGTSKGNGDVVVMKLDAEDGSVIWTKRFGGPSTEYAYDVHIASDGGYLIAGSTGSASGDITSNAGLYDAWILKLDTDGNLEWQKTHGSIGYEYAYKIQETSDGGYVIFGESRTNAKMPDGVGASYDMWVLKVDGAGNEDFNLTLGGSLDDNLKYGTQTSDGGYIIVGYSKSSNGDFTTNSGEEDGWVIKLKSNGTVDWKKAFASTIVDKCHVVKEDTDNGFILLSTEGYKSTLNSYLKLTKLNSSGTEVWKKTFSAVGTFYACEVNDGIFTADGGYLAVGGSAATQLKTFYSEYTATLVKLGGTDNPAIASLWPSKATNKTMNIYPNPAATEFKINIDQPMEIRIVNILGETVLMEQAALGESTIDVSSLAPGTYYVLSGNNSSGQLVVVK